MNTQTKEPSFLERNRVIIKGFMVGVLTLLMLIPGAFIAELVKERQARQQEVVNEVSSKWAGAQTVIGPVLMLPYKDYQKNSTGQTVESMKTAFILPDELKIDGDMQPLEKKRSLYSVMLYKSQLKLSGKFGIPPLAQLQIPAENIQWQDARIALSVGDMRGIEDLVHLDWNGSKHSMEAGEYNNLFKEGLSVPVVVNMQNPSSFSININLRGSGYLYFTPVGKTTEADVHANWKDPAFDGQTLPVSSEITDKDFKAHWKVLPMSHTYPQYWREHSVEFEKAAFGVRLIQPVDGYTKTHRSVKYAILFIALTFTFFFFLEILQKRQVHPLQYLLVGIALSIFYTLLLSISEYTGFNMAYLVASVATISLIGLYTWSIFNNGKTALSFTATLTALYTYIFVLIQLEDYALLFGSIGLFVIVAIIMYYSRKIDWYAVTPPETYIKHEDQPGMPRE